MANNIAFSISRFFRCFPRIYIARIFQRVLPVARRIEELEKNGREENRGPRFINLYRTCKGTILQMSDDPL